MDALDALICALDPENRSVIFFGQDVQITVRAVFDISNSLIQLCEQRLAATFVAVLIEVQPDHVSGPLDLAHSQAANENTTLPWLQVVSGVERKPRG